MDGKKERRGDIRIPLLSEVITFDTLPIDGAKIYTESCQLLNISKVGVFIKTTANLKAKSYINLRLTLPGDLGQLQIRGQIVWRRWHVAKDSVGQHIGIGVEFVDVSEGMAKLLDAYTVYLRNKQIIQVSKRIIEEFFEPNV